MKIKLLLLLLLLLLSCSSKHDSNKIYDYKNNYWTNDLEEIELVMSYIFNIDDYQKIIQMNEEEKIRLGKEVSINGVLQMAIKVTLNSAFGELGSE